MKKKFTKRAKTYIALALSVLVILVAAGLSLMAASPAADPIKNAYLNGAIAPDNGTSAAPVTVTAGDNITYELIIDKPDLADSGGQYDILFVLDWSGSMETGSMTGSGKAKDYARSLALEMSKYVFNNYPNSRISVMGYTCHTNNTNNPAYLALRYDTPFVGASDYESVIVSSMKAGPGYSHDDNALALRAAIDKISGDTSVTYGTALETVSQKTVVPRDELSAGRIPIIVLISDFQATDAVDRYSNYNSTGQLYWSEVFKAQADRYDALYPNGILHTIRLDYGHKYNTAQYDNLMTTYLSPAGRAHWSFTKIAKNVKPADGLKLLQGVFTQSAPVPKKVTVTDVIPDGMTILSTNPAATVTGQKVEWDLTGQPADTYTLSIAVQVDASAGSAIINYENSATVSIEGQTDTKSNTTYHRLGEPAAVITGDPDNLKENSATIVNNTYSNVTGTISNIGIQYGTDPSLVFATTTVPATTIGSPFAVDLNYLQPDTTYSYRAVVQTSTGLLYGDIKTFVTPSVVQKPVVVTGDAGNITQNSATITNNTYSGITGTVNNVGIQYNTSPTLATATTVRGTSIGSPFTVDLTNLQPNTTYYYRAGVQTASGIQYGEIKTFVTPNVVQTPIVVTGDPNNITETSATIIDNTYSGFTGTINNVGIQYSTNATLASAKTARGTAIGSPFTVDLTGLQPDTTYYYRAGVQTASGMVFGDIKSFVTPNVAQTPVVVTGDPNNITETSATIIDNTYSGFTGTINNVGVQYSTNATLASATTVRGTAIGSPFSVDLTGLQPDTTYYYRAGVQSASGMVFGDIKQFTTPAKTLNVVTGFPIDVVADSAFIIENTYANISGTLEFVAVQFSTDPSLASATVVSETTAMNSPFYVQLTGLQPDTTYYYRAGVKTSTDTYYGQIESFTTPPQP